MVHQKTLYVITIQNTLYCRVLSFIEFKIVLTQLEVLMVDCELEFPVSLKTEKAQASMAAIWRSDDLA